MAVGLVLVSGKLRQPTVLPPTAVSLKPDHLVADGYDYAVLSIQTEAPTAPSISISGVQGLRIQRISGTDGYWRARIQAGIMAGTADVKVNVAGAKPASAQLYLSLDSRDGAEDGTPDFLRLEDEHDREAFRQWFTYLAEAQYFQSPSERPPEINDCAALIRYAYREALVAHEGIWATSAHLPLVPAFESPSKYQYPYTPLGSALFRVKAGAFRNDDLNNGAFLQFADARTLWRYNSHFVSRNLTRALPGDLLFFRQSTGREPFHSMIYLGASQLRPDRKRYVLYHTGPEGDDPGEIKRLTLEGVD